MIFARSPAGSFRIKKHYICEIASLRSSSSCGRVGFTYEVVFAKERLHGVIIVVQDKNPVEMREQTRDSGGHLSELALQNPFPILII